MGVISGGYSSFNHYWLAFFSGLNGLCHRGLGIALVLFIVFYQRLRSRIMSYISIHISVGSEL